VSKKDEIVSAVRVGARPGEGAALSVSRRIVPRPDGTNAVELSVDLQAAPVPERRYVADACAVLRSDDFVLLAFGQRRLVGSGCRSLVVLSMSAEAIRSFLKTCDGFLERVAAFLERNGLARSPLLDLTEEPPQTVHLAANVVAVAQAGRESCLDLYHVSPWSIRSVSTRNQLVIDPIVRIDMPTALLVPVVEQLVRLEHELPPEVR
jgi:hypothetical protein